MKTSTLPSLRVDPEFRKAAEAVLHEGETLSSFVEASVRAQILQRQQQQDFIARGLVSREQARKTGAYVSADAVVKGLRTRLEKAKRRKA